jgi:hypothetical protein
LVLISLQGENGQNLYEEEKEREIKEEEKDEENDIEKEEQEERKRKAVEEEELKEFNEQKNDKVGLSPLLMINLWCQPNNPELEIIARPRRPILRRAVKNKI